MRTACEQYMAWKKLKNMDQILMVNLSVMQIKDENFLPTLERILSETGMPPHSLELEITEMAFIENSKIFEEALDKIHKLGVKIGIDNFGTGYFSLNLLKQLKPDTLKIDTSFIKNIHFRSKSHNNLIVQSIIMLAKGLNLNVIAEGIEAESQESFLKDNDCQEVQGYYYRRPMTAQDIEILLDENSQST